MGSSRERRLLGEGYAKGSSDGSAEKKPSGDLYYVKKLLSPRRTSYAYLKPPYPDSRLYKRQTSLCGFNLYPTHSVSLLLMNAHLFFPS